MDKIQENSFNELLLKLNDLKLLPHLIIMGSWAEYLYCDLFDSNYKGMLKTRDVDIMYFNICKPNVDIPIIPMLEEIGYQYKEDIVTGVAKFKKEGILELEFLTRALGKGENVVKIKPLNIKSESLRTIDILEQHQEIILYHGINVIVPKPAAFVIQKIIVNPTRTPFSKKEKDILSCNHLLEIIIRDEESKQLFYDIYKSLSKKQTKIFLEVVDKYQMYFAKKIINQFEQSTETLFDEKLPQKVFGNDMKQCDSEKRMDYELKDDKINNGELNLEDEY